MSVTVLTTVYFFQQCLKLTTEQLQETYDKKHINYKD